MAMDKLLIVEDEKLIRWSIREMLERQDYEILEAPTGREAFSILEEQDCDLVISLHVNAFDDPIMRAASGYHMPDDEVGEETCEAILRAWPRRLIGRGRSWGCDVDDGKWLQRPLNVLEVHECPAILIEVGFASNPEDAAALQDPWVQDAMLPALMCGLYRFGELKEKRDGL